MKKIIAVVIGLIIIFIIFIAFFPSLSDNDQFEVIPAYNFTAVSEGGIEFSLSDYKGNVTLLHFTGLETPLCIECEEEMTQQLEQIESLIESNTDVKIITINIRKNPFSESGKDIAENDYNINVSWHWIEDFEPYQYAGLYQEYWTVNGAFSNPTIVLINANQSIVGVYNVYCLGIGKIDGVQTAESLDDDIKNIYSGEWEGFQGGDINEGITFVGIFLLGILTSLSPCSIALLIAMISYVGSLQKQVKNNAMMVYLLKSLLCFS